MKQRIQHEFQSNQYYFYFALSITALTISPQLYFSPDATHSWYLLISSILLFLMAKFSKILFSFFIVFINLSNVLIGHIALHWGYTNPEIQPRLEVAFLSPIYEIREYLQSYVDYRDYLMVLYTLGILFFLYRFLRHYTHSYKVLKAISLGLSLSILLMVTYFINPLKEMEPFSVPNEFLSILEDKKNIDYILQKRQAYLQQTTLPKSEQKNQLYDKIIVVMGESVNKSHMGIYGYRDLTTPFFSALQAKQQLYVFDAIAPTNQTRYSLPIDLTEANVRYYEDRYLRSCSVLTHFKANDYTTYWISNQGRTGKNDSTITSMANEANITFFANVNYLEAKTDQVIVDYLNGLEHKHSKEMFLLHLMGSHSDYPNRYVKDKALFNNPKNMVEEYDNTIYYTDFILSQIYARFKGDRLLLIYLSDHGENINLENNGHGFMPSFKDEYTVPLVIYSSVKNRRLDELVHDNEKGRFNLENLDYLIRYVSGISNHKNLSFSNKVMEVEPSHLVNFDELEFYN